MNKAALALGFVCFTSMPVVAKADLILGVMNITGIANISLGEIGFAGNTFSINGPAGSQQGGFTALAGTTGTIANLTDPPDAVGSPLNIPNYITFAAAPNISITLTFLIPGIDGSAGCSAAVAAAGEICTPNVPSLSPFNLADTSATASAASFNILGVEVDSATGATIPITGAFTTPFTDQTFQQLLASVEAGDTVTTSFSGQFSTGSAIPEPGTLAELTIGMCLSGFGMIYRRKHSLGKGRLQPSEALDR